MEKNSNSAVPNLEASGAVLDYLMARNLCHINFLKTAPQYLSETQENLRILVEHPGAHWPRLVQEYLLSGST